MVSIIIGSMRSGSEKRGEVEVITFLSYRVSRLDLRLLRRAGITNAVVKICIGLWARGPSFWRGDRLT